MTFAPRFSPDGQEIVMSLSDGASTNLYSMDLRSRATTRLDRRSAIDTSPTYSPDGSQIAFESDRGGSQQIYVMSATRRSGQAHLLRRRPLFDAGLVAARRPHRLHPHQERLVRHRRDEAGRLGRAHPGRRLPQRGSDLRARTGSISCSSATPAAPAAPKIYMTDIFGHGEFLVPTPNYASDPSWGPLMQ